MRIGVSLKSVYGTDNVREGARRMIARGKAARDAGLDSLFVGDHHMVPIPYYQNTPMLGRLLADWDDRPVGFLALIPLWNPVHLAEQVGTLASIASGRFILQCAIGDGSDQFRGMGTSLSERVPRFEEGLRIVRRLCAGEDVDGLRIAPTTPQPLEVWVGGTVDRAIDRAARLGDGWLADPSLTPTRARERLEHYRSRCDAHGREPTAIAIRRDVHVGSDDADADRVAGPVLEAGYRGFDPSAVIVGGPERVAERIGELGEMGYTDVIVRHLARDDDENEVLRSFERLARVRELVNG